jgi:ribosomal protein S18 acetylase RimI-like enzyme
VIVRVARPGEVEEIGDLRVGAYQAEGLLNEQYAGTLRALGQDGHGTVFVAVDDNSADTTADDSADTTADGSAAGSRANSGKLLGTVMLEPWHAGSEVARSADEAEVRALAVAPWAQGRGTGRALMRAVIGAAAASGARRLLLSTQTGMTTAQRLYRSLGFQRAPELDWQPVPEVPLLGFILPLDGSALEGPAESGRRDQ